MALLCAATALLLGSFYHFVLPAKAERMRRYRTAMAAPLVKNGRLGEEKIVKDSASVVSYAPVRDRNGKTAVYLVTLSGKGYGGEMLLLAGYKPEGEVLAVRLLRHEEMPGFGGKAVEASYMDKFIGKGAAKPIPVAASRLSQAEAAAVSGASVTFAGIGKALTEGSDFVKRLGGSK